MISANFVIVNGPPSAEQALGALPVVAGFCRRLDIAGIIDRAAPVREIARATHGQVIEALIASRLTSPSPRVHVGAWARQFAVARVLGVAPDVLNDDRIARALDALARRVFVHSSANADAAGRARARKLEQAAEDLDRLTRGLGSRHYPDAAKVTARITAIAAGRHVGDYLRADAGTAPDGRPTLQWHFGQAAVDAEAATDGWYALLTNLPANVTAAQVLTRYENQPTASERRYHDLKGPLAIAPMFLHANRRITAIIGVICMALLIYSLIERQTRRNLAPAARLDGLYAGRPAKPTARLIFTALATLSLRAGAGDGPPQIPQPDPVQQQLLDLLEIDPRKLADPPHLMCELRV